MNDIAIAEKPADILTIEPEQYVAQVFEPFTKRLAVAVAEVKDVEFDVATTAGMKTAVTHRALFRDLRLESEDARKKHKAPILEIGRLLDSRAKEVAALITPHEERFDKEIKAEEARKEAEKQAKLAAERERVNRIQDCIREFRIAPRAMPGKTAAEFMQHADDLANTPVTEEFFQEFREEAVTARDDAVAEMREIAATAEQREQEQARIAAERAELDRCRAEQDERDRQAAAQIQEAQRKAREAQEQAAAAMRAEQAAHLARMAEQQAEIDRKQAAVDAERQRQEAAAEAVRRAEREAAAEVERQEQARIEAKRQAEQDAKRAAEEEEAHRLRVDFEANGPEPLEIVEALAKACGVSPGVALAWLRKTNWKKIEVSQ